MVAEVVGGLVAGSLPCSPTRGTCSPTSRRWRWPGSPSASPAPGRHARTYGFDRLSVLAAFVNGLALFVVAGLDRGRGRSGAGDPQPVAGGLMLVVAAVGLAVNLLALLVLSARRPGNLNLRAALLHVAGTCSARSPPSPPPSSFSRPAGRRSTRSSRCSSRSLSCARPGAWCATARTSSSRGRRRASTPGLWPPTCARTSRRRRRAARARLVDHRGAPDGHARGGDRVRCRPRHRPPPDQGAPAEHFGFDHATVEICVEPANAQVAEPRARVYLDAHP